MTSTTATTAPTTSAPAAQSETVSQQMDITASALQTDAPATSSKKKGGRGAPKKEKDPSHDVKSSGGSSKKERAMRNRTLIEKTVSKPALTKLFCPKVKSDKVGDGDKYVYLDKEHKGVRISKNAIKSIQQHWANKLQSVVASMVFNMKEKGKTTIAIDHARDSICGVLPYSSVFVSA